ncbi:MAG: chemotaxis protein CheW [Kiritimatiellaeota bacterium]|nr:chemotaxis protein CheW [Kiritimatiellota bacterium]
MNVTTIQDCWNRIGVQGDMSCPELRRHIHCRNCPTFEQGAHALLNRQPPAGYIEEWTQFLARAKETEAGFTDAALVFRIGPEWLALSARLCVEIVTMRPIRRVPHRSDRMLMGLASVRGELLLCFSLANLLGLEPGSRLEPSAESSAAAETSAAANAASQALPRLLVARKDRFNLAFPVDEVMGLHRFHRDTIQAIPATVAHAVPQFSRGMFTADERKIGLLDDELVFHALTKVLA